MEEEKLNEQQINEVNERVKEIISNFRIALLNTASYDLENYWRFGMNGDVEHVAFQKLFNVKQEIVQYLEKETRLVCQDVELYHARRREVCEDIMNDMLLILEPAMRGRRSDKKEDMIWERKVLHIANKVIDKSEYINKGMYERGKVYSREKSACTNIFNIR